MSLVRDRSFSALSNVYSETSMLRGIGYSLLELADAYRERTEFMKSQVKKETDVAPNVTGGRQIPVPDSLR